MNVMRSLAMIDGAPEKQDPVALPGSYRYWGSLSASAAGVLWPRIKLGTLLAKGNFVAEITDLYGDILKTIVSPAQGFMWSFNGALYGVGTHVLPEGSDIGFFAEKVE